MYRRRFFLVVKSFTGDSPAFYFGLGKLNKHISNGKVIIMKPFGVILAIQIFAYSAYSAELTATEVVSRADKLFRGASNHSAITMKIVRPDWSRSLSMKVWSKGDDYSLILITAPARDKGTSFMKRGNEVWQWVPSIQRVIKIPPSMMSQSWMGSDFTNDDLVKEASVVNDYTHRFLADTTINDTPMYRVELTPKPDVPVVWDKIIEWITKSTYIQRRGEYFDETGRIVDVLRMENVKKLGGRLIPTDLEMIPTDKKGQKTVLNYQSIEFDIPLKESFFSLQNMKQVR
jgi:outer membrane lipoprotein-sorting protein